jgi:hypothetical protein
MPKWLTKSKYLNGLQCPKLLWLTVNEPERVPAPDAATQQLFDQGRIIGEFARQLFPEGIKVPYEDFLSNIRTTKKLLQQRKPLFEAGVRAGRIYARLDIMLPTEHNNWDIVEVKSATSIKDVNLDDIAFQKLVCEENNIPIHRCYLIYINNKYVRHGEVNPEELFVMTDVSKDVFAKEDGIRKRVMSMFNIIDSKPCPDISIGPHCSEPYECRLEECWGNLPENNVFTLYKGGSKSWDLYRSGVADISCIPEGFPLNEKQQIQVNGVQRGEVHIDVEQIQEFLSSIVYPLYCLDFETIGPAVSLFDNSRPYQNIPFQYSLHVQASPCSRRRHYAFLAEGQNDPRPALLKKLRKEIGSEGTVLAYNKSFEEHVLRESADAFPEYAGWVENVTGRMVDLIVPFRSFAYYNPSQQGSASLKKVLPAVTGKSYTGMDIAEGGEASRRFLDIMFGDASPEEVQQTRKALLKYCGQDTLGMVWIVEKLTKLVGV